MQESLVVGGLAEGGMCMCGEGGGGRGQMMGGG